MIPGLKNRSTLPPRPSAGADPPQNGPGRLTGRRPAADVGRLRLARGERRRLGRRAAEDGWTVRETEARARLTAEPHDAATPRASRSRAHPDQLAAAERLQEVFGRALGTDVRVAPRRDGYTVTLAVDSLAAAEALAERLGTLEPR